MNLDDDYQYILALATYGSLSAAAKQLNVTHTTVARRIQAFETRYSVRLFERVSKGFQLTQVGHSILPDIEHLKSLQLHIERRLVGHDQSLTGEINLALTPELANDYVVPILPAFYKQFPNLQLNLMMSTHHKDLYAREADIALRFTPEPTQANLIGKRLFASNWGVYASEQYWQHNKNITTQKLLLWHLESDKNWYKDVFAKTQVIAKFDNLAALINAVKAGVGIAKLPCGLVDQPHLSSIRRIDISLAPSIWSLWLLYHFDLKNTAKINAVKTFLLEHLKPLETRFSGQTSQYF